jgi:hypothetical protein
MDEPEYWRSLEFRVTREFGGMREQHFRYFWCDGFVPERYLLDAAAPRITGRAFICDGPKQDEWEFVLLLPRPMISKHEIDWSSLLPGESMTRWLRIDPDGKRVQIELAQALPR